MKSTSAFDGFRKGAFAVSGVRVLLLCPGAPGCTIVTPVAVFDSWHNAVAEIRESNPAAKTGNLWDMTFLTSNAQNLMSRVIAET
jgi:hypothetical protein